jgi:hypothetical protein
VAELNVPRDLLERLVSYVAKRGDVGWTTQKESDIEAVAELLSREVDGDFASAITVRGSAEPWRPEALEEVAAAAREYVRVGLANESAVAAWGLLLTALEEVDGG